jgi:hypothetical protein
MGQRSPHFCGLGLKCRPLREARSTTATPAAKEGLSLAQLTSLLSLNSPITMREEFLSQAFPPGIDDDAAFQQCKAFAEKQNCNVSLDTRQKTAKFERRQ